MGLKSRVKGILRGFSARSPGLFIWLTERLIHQPRLALALVSSLDARLGLSGIPAQGPLRGRRFENLLVDELLPVLQNGMEAECSELLTLLDLQGGIALDIGASYGYYGVLLSGRVGSSGLVYCFEPDAASFVRLVHNLSINRCSNVIPVPYAVGSANGLAWWAVNTDQPWLGHLTDTGSVPVATIALDTFVTALPPGRLRLIKLDIEGAEADVLEASARTLTEARPMALIELHSTPIAARVIRLLRGHNYRVHRVEYQGEERHHIWAYPLERAAEWQPIAVRYPEETA